MLAVARSLIASGVEPGDRVAIWAPNSAAWITAALGVLAARAWLVPLNTRLKGDEASFILEMTDARVLFAADGFLDIDYTASLPRRRAGPRGATGRGPATASRGVNEPGLGHVPRPGSCGEPRAGRGCDRGGVA